MKNMDYDILPNKCASKMDALKRRYRKIIDHNKQSGNDLMTFKYFDIKYIILFDFGTYKIIKTIIKQF